MTRRPSLLRALAFAGLLAAGPARADVPLGDLLAHRTERYAGTLALDPATGRIDATLTLDARIQGPDRAAIYLLAPLPVTAAGTPDGAPLAVSDAGGGFVRVDLPAPAADGALVPLVVTLAGTPSCALGDVLGRRLCRFGDAAWVDLSRVLPASVLGDFATLDLDVQVPAGLAVAASGDVAAPVAHPDGREAHRVMQAAPSTMHGLAAGPWVRGGMTAGGVALRTFTSASPAVLDALPGVLGRAAAAVAAYEDDLGPLPFDAISLVEVPPDAGAALALPGLILMPSGIWTGDGGGTLHPADLGFLVPPHELAHQWVPCTLAPAPLSGRPWTMEGMAELLALDRVAAERGPAAARAIRARYGRDVAHRVPPAADVALASLDPMTATDPRAYYVLAYEKGALVWGAIRRVAGPAAWDAAWAALAAEVGGRDAWFDAGLVRQRLEAKTGKDLGWLFDAWTARSGHPVYTVLVAPPDGDGGAVQVRIDQASAPGGPLFRMPLVFAIRTTAGTSLRTETVQDLSTGFAWPVDGRFLSLELDPDVTFPRQVVPGLPGDTDLSGEVDAIDLVGVAAALGRTIDDEAFPDAADLDGSGAVDAADLEAVLGGFGTVGSAQ